MHHRPPVLFSLSFAFVAGLLLPCILPGIHFEVRLFLFTRLESFRLYLLHAACRMTSLGPSGLCFILLRTRAPAGSCAV
ncbi:hypothetical protein C8R45DRAFT_960571 [Mycena sanguinolenta]|nr:hypothetical protein C8R45DRAFT_960571 [Mycena sanguinolenta]